MCIGRNGLGPSAYEVFAVPRGFIAVLTVFSASTAAVTSSVAVAPPAWLVGLLLAPAALALVGAVTSQRAADMRGAWTLARITSTALLVLGAGSAVARVAIGERANMWLRSDTVGVTMLVLVTFIGWVIVRYSEAYLSGDPHERQYIGRLLTTLSTVVVVVIANHLIALALAWSATSLLLHGLLTFYRDRPVAMAVAHKKFILARVADVCMIGAVVAFATSVKTLRIDEIAEKVSSNVATGPGVRVAIVFVALAALLKCAQLPFHGWLIQVMEAPTPVSALLHAGIVNLGGFVLLRFSAVVDRSIETRALLVIVGTLTAVVAAVVMTTRISVKVFLAWSTCAQMGFMLMQCGLGLWEMALLHLVAHSLYKAHAFLGAGGVVRKTQRKQLLSKPPSPTTANIMAGLGFAAVATIAAGWAWSRLASVGGPSATLWVMTGIVAVSIVPLLAKSNHRGRIRPSSFGTAIAVPFVYFGLHALAAELVPHGSTPPVALLIGVVLGFTVLFVVQVLCAMSPNNSFLRRLYPWFYGGLFLDEAFTRRAFRIWPPPAVEVAASTLPLRTSTLFPIAGVAPGRSKTAPFSSATAKPSVLDGGLI